MNRHQTAILALVDNLEPALGWAAVGVADRLVDQYRPERAGAFADDYRKGRMLDIGTIVDMMGEGSENADLALAHVLATHGKRSSKGRDLAPSTTRHGTSRRF